MLARIHKNSYHDTCPWNDYDDKIEYDSIDCIMLNINQLVDVFSIM